MPEFRSVRERRRIKAALARLPRPERDILRLCAGEGLDLAAAAARLNIAPSEAEARLARAILRLDRTLRRRRPWWCFW